MPKNFDASILTSSYAQYYLSSWTVFRVALFKHLSHYRPNESTDTINTAGSITVDIFQNAQEGPFGALFETYAYWYCKLEHLRFLIRFDSDPLFVDAIGDDNKDQSIDLPNETRVPKNIIESMAQIDLEKHIHSLSECFNESMNTWKALTEQCNQQIMHTLSENGLKLDDLSGDIFVADEPLCDLINAYKEVKLSLPKKHSKHNLTAFLQIKTYYHIHQQLAKKQESNDEKNLLKWMQKVDKLFKQIEQEEIKNLNIIDESLQSIASIFEYEHKK